MISEKQIKTLAAKKKALISDEKFFTSKTLQRYFVELAMMLTKRYGFKLAIKVKLLWNPNDEFIAATDNNIISINCANFFIKKYKKREDKLDIIKGLFAHELGHVLFTDFEIMELFLESISVYKWFPKRPEMSSPQDENSIDEIDIYIRKNPKNIKRFLSVAHHIDNIIEDGYIEESFMQKYKGNLCEGLYLVREAHFESIDKIWQLVEKTELDPKDEGYLHPFQAICQLLLCFAKFSDFKYDDVDELKEDIVQQLLPCLDFTDSALVASNPRFRRIHVNEVIVTLWPQIKSYLEYLESMPEPEEGEGNGSGNGSGSGSGSSVVDKSLSKSTKGSSSSGKGSSRPADTGGATENEDAKQKRATTKSSLKDDKSEEEGSSGDSKEKGSEESNNGAIPSNGEENGNTNSINSFNNKQDIVDEEAGRIPEHDTDSISTPDESDDNDVEDDDYDPEIYSKAASDIENLLNKIATQEAEEELESQRLKELNNEGRNINYGDAHRGINVTVRRITSVPDSLKEQYDLVAPELCKISKKLQKLISQKLKDKRAGGKRKNLYMGRKLEARAIIRDDGKSFYNKKRPDEAPTICIAVLLDESGSMYSYNRATYARATGIVLFDFCNGLKLPCCIYGHTSQDIGSGINLQMQAYAEFDSIDKDDKYRLMDISARANNRDGAALKFMYDKLDQRQEDIKLLIVVSDGQPNAYRYSGSAAENDMKTLKETYSRKGITTFAAAIGSDKNNIERIYGDGFLDISDLTKLPEILTKLILSNINI